MQPESPAHDASRDPVADGRDSLRLVKLRLALTLITVAVLPVAAVAPLVRAIAEEGRATHQQLLQEQASSAALDIRRAVAGIRVSIADALEGEVMTDAARKAAGPPEKIAASNLLRSLIVKSDGTVLGAALLTADGKVASSGTIPDLEKLPASVLVSGIATPSAGGGQRLLSVESTGPGVKPARSIVVELSVPHLVVLSAAESQLPGRTVRLSDAKGRLVGLVEGPFDPAAIPGEVLEVAGMASGASDGRADLGVPGLDGWSVSVSAPIPLVNMPAQALGALGALLVLLVGFTTWMARQILRPARQLEASRSRLRELYESAREAALMDSLTGLGNHRAFQEAVARMVEGARRYGTAFSLVLMDIDEFKRINDTKGHATGDQLLVEVGSLIHATIRTTDSAFRVGGDEFAILLPHTDASGAVVLARRLLARGLEDRVAGQYRWPISFSAGVTACPEYATTRLELTAQADAALYRGKRTGRTVVTIYDPEKDHGHVDEGMRAELSSAITAVIEAGTLSPVYQPIVDLTSGRVIGYEGLVRVPRESTFAHTGALFDAAEVAGRVHDLDRAALDVVLRGAGGLPDAATLSVNVSPRTLESPEFSAAAFLAILRRHGLPPARVVLELTEREAIRDADRLRSVLVGVQDAGARIAADDVGAGNAGLRLLSQFRFDVVKIDLSLVQRAGEGQTHSVLRSIVEVAQRMGATTIAEGVETSVQLRTARRLGITAGQGYLLGRPGPDRDIGWVDIAALEQREDVAIPIEAGGAPPPPDAGATRRASLSRRIEAVAAGEPDPEHDRGPGRRASGRMVCGRGPVRARAE